MKFLTAHIGIGTTSVHTYSINYCERLLCLISCTFQIVMLRSGRAITRRTYRGQNSKLQSVPETKSINILPKSKNHEEIALMSTKNAMNLINSRIDELGTVAMR